MNIYCLYSVESIFLMVYQYASVNSAFSFRDVVHEWQDMTLYLYVFIEEVSQVSDSDIFPLFNSILFVSQSY